MPEHQNASVVLDALANTNGWAIERNDKRKQVKITLWYNQDDTGNTRARAILKALGKEE